MGKMVKQTVNGVDYPVFDENAENNVSGLMGLFRYSDSIPIYDWERRTYYHNGTKYSNDSWSATKVPVTPNLYYFIYGPSAFFYAFYTSGNAFISGASVPASSMHVDTPYRIQAPSNASYVYLSFNDADIQSNVITVRTSSFTDASVLRIHPYFSLSRNANETKAAKLTDLNKAQENTLYSIQVTSRSYLANLPTDFPVDSSPFKLFTFHRRWVDTSESNTYAYHQREQILFNHNFSVVYTRSTKNTDGSWYNWTKFTNQVTNGAYIECGAGKAYTTLRSAIEAGCAVPYSTVVVYPGTYDLTQEFASEISAQTARGIELSNNVNVVFLSGAYVKALFPSTNEYINTYFQPFWGKNFTLDGLNIEASNCRYCVHDEQSGANVSYHNVYKNCVMKMTADSNQETHYRQCIGGGLGKYGFIEIIGGEYTSVDSVSGSYIDAISYHNGGVAGADSKFFIKDVYLADGNCFRFGYYGSSTIKSPVYISGCSMGGEIIMAPETESSTSENFKLIAWNNEIRT